MKVSDEPAKKYVDVVVSGTASRRFIVSTYYLCAPLNVILRINIKRNNRSD